MDDLVCPDNEFVVIVTGSRKWMRGYRVFEDLNFCYDTGNLVGVIHGGAKGADSAAHNWLRDPPDPHPDVAEHVFPADWDTHSKAAGPIRNRAMIQFALDARGSAGVGIIVLAYPLPDSRGTKDLIRQARLRRLRVFDRSDDA